MQFITKDSVLFDALVSCYNNNEVTEVPHKFLGLVKDNTLSWNLNIDNVINKLTRVCYKISCISFSSLIMI
jgi:hypothetical protein